MNNINLFNLTDKKAIVTGGANGIGRQMCFALANQGSTIAILDIDEGEAKNTIDHLPNPEKHLYINTDITNPEQVNTAVNEIYKKFNSIDILLNNAGICQRVDTSNMSKEDWNKTFEINVTGMFLVSKFVFEVMKKQKRGSIINVASMAGIISLTYAQSAYNASKAAVIQLTKSLAQEWITHGIRVNAIAPGFIKSDMTKPMFEGDGPLSHVLDQVPMKRLGAAEELSGPIILLSSDASSFMTGTTISVDGGYTMI